MSCHAAVSLSDHCVTIKKNLFFFFYDAERIRLICMTFAESLSNSTKGRQLKDEFTVQTGIEVLFAKPG